MEITDRQRRLLELCAIRVDRQSVDWSLIARQVQDAIGLDDLSQGIITEKSTAAERSRPVLRKGLRHMGPLADRVTAELEAASEAGARLVTVLDPDYPANLRLIPNLPPFLFYRGTLSDDDARSVAVVGTRQASETGLRRAATRARTGISPRRSPIAAPWSRSSGPQLRRADPPSRAATLSRVESARAAW